MGEAHGAVVLLQGVILADEPHIVGPEARLIEGLSEAEDVRPWRQVHSLLPVELLVPVDVEGPRAAREGAGHHLQLKGLTDLHPGREKKLLDGHLLVIGLVQSDDIDADVVGLGDPRLVDSAAQCLVPIGQQDDPLGGVLREAGEGQSDGLGDVRLVRVEHGLDAGDLWGEARRSLHVGLITEHDDAHLVLAATHAFGRRPDEVHGQVALHLAYRARSVH